MKKHPTGSSIPGFAFDINRVFKNKLQAVSQGDDGLEAWRLER
jgi:hypothetical protein